MRSGCRRTSQMPSGRATMSWSSSSAAPRTPAVEAARRARSCWPRGSLPTPAAESPNARRGRNAAALSGHVGDDAARLHQLDVAVLDAAPQVGGLVDGSWIDGQPDVEAAVVGDRGDVERGAGDRPEWDVLEHLGAAHV